MQEETVSTKVSPSLPSTRECPGCGRLVRKRGAATGECHRCRAHVHNDRYQRSVERRGRVAWHGAFGCYKTAVTYLEQLRRWGMEGYRVVPSPLGWSVVREDE